MAGADGPSAPRVALCALALSAWLLAACAPAAPAPASAVKIFLAEPGLYRLTRADLQAAGLSVDGAALERLALTHHGAEIPLEVRRDGREFSLLFYAAPQPHPFSAAEVYWLALGAGPGLRTQERAIETPRGGPAAQSFQAALRLEEDLLYFPNAVGEAHWFWRSLSAPASESLTLFLPGYAWGEARLTLALAGLTEGPHLAQILVNGQPAGEASWQGATPHRFETTTAALQAGQNTLTLQMPGAAGQAEVNLLDWIEVIYPRAFTAHEGALAFEGPAGDLRVAGFPEAGILLYDVQDPLAAERLTGFQESAADGAYAVAFHAAQPGRYLALAPGAALRPLEIRPARPGAPDLRAADQQADYLIIAPREFFAALEPLRAHRAAAGLNARLVDIEQVYDAFSGGVPDPRALREFLRYARERWAAPAPRFALLVGKASYDYRDNLDGPNKNLVPTYLVATPHLGQAASDNWFAARSEADLTPTLALGRIPAKTPAQVKTAVDKILAYEAGLAAGEAGWRGRAVFVADDKDPLFDRSSDMLAEALAPGVVPERIYLSAHAGDVAAARAEIVRAWNEGALLLTYIGHGSIDTWAAGPLFSSGHVPELRNGARLPILFTPTCLDGYFYHPQTDSLAEELLFKTGGGIVAGLAPTGLSLPAAQDRLMAALFAELFARPAPTLGEAIQRARVSVGGDDSPAVREVLETFVLLGDPALRWQVPES